MADNKKRTIWWIVGGFLVLYLFVPAFKGTVDDILGGILPSGGETPPSGGGYTPPPAIEFCPYDGATMTIGPMQKMYSPTTSMSSEWARVYVKGTDKGLKNDDTTMTVTYKDDVDIYYGENSSTYYAAKQSFKVPCAASFSTADDTLRSDDEFKLYQQDASADLNLKCRDDDDGLLNPGLSGGTAGGSEDLSVGDLVNIECSLQGTYEDAFSPYGNLILVLEYNTTYYDEIKITGGLFEDGTVPQFVTNAYSTTGNGFVAFERPGIISNEKVDFTLTLDVHDTNTPGAINNHTQILIVDEDWYRNTDTGKMEFGAENNDDTDVGRTRIVHGNYTVS